MKKTQNKPVHGQKKENASPERKPISTSVDWAIPGDVPEEHRRLISPYSSAIKPAQQEPEKTRSNVPANTGVTNAPPDEPYRSSIHTQTEYSRQRRSYFQLGKVIILFSIMGLGGLGYVYISGDDEKILATNTGENGVGDTVASEEVPAVMQEVLSNGAEASPDVRGKDMQPEIAASVVQEPRFITHIVKKGDTLWDIANQYVNDPFQYPELAELSEIENPDLIYPGDIVRIRV